MLKKRKKLSDWFCFTAFYSILRKIPSKINKQNKNLFVTKPVGTYYLLATIWSDIYNQFRKKNGYKPCNFECLSNF